MKTRLFALTLAALLLLSACAAGPAPGGSSGGASSQGGSSGASSQPDAAPAYFGDWEVTSSAGTAPVCAMSQEEIDACVGLTVSYGEDSFTADGLTCEFLPGTAYTEDVITAEAFQAACGLPPSDVGVTASMLLHVTVNIEGNAGQNRLLGRDFFVLGADRLLIYCDGAFFLAQPQSAS